MSAKRLSLTLVVLCFSLRVLAVTPQIDAKTRQVRQAIQKVVEREGLGPKAHVALRLKDKATLEGYVSRIGQDDFEVTNSSLHSRRTIDFRDVDRVATDIRQILTKGRRSTAPA